MPLKKKIVISIIAILGIVSVFTIYKITSNSTEKQNLAELNNTLRTLNDGEYELKDIIPFEWDSIYSFETYTSKDKIADVIGFDSKAIKETVNEGMQQVIFIKDGKLACDIYGYIDKLGYSFNFGDNWSEYVELKSSEQNYFNISNENDIKYIVYKK